MHDILNPQGEIFLSSSCFPHPLDQDIGYGPGLESTDSGKLLESKYEDAFHPPAPPITSAGGGRMEANKEVLKFDSNFLMAKPGESNEIRHVRGMEGGREGGREGALMGGSIMVY